MEHNRLAPRTIEAVVNKLGGIEGVERFLRGELVIKTPEGLKKVAEVAVSDAKRFVAKDHLSKANVVWTSDNFRRFFLEFIEENVEGITLFVHRLEKVSLDAPILAELGDRAQISLAHFFELFEKQSKGEVGPLLTNRYANIAYITGSDGNLWALDAYWYGDGWYVYADSVDHPYRWGDGNQVLSR